MSRYLLTLKISMETDDDASARKLAHQFIESHDLTAYIPESESEKTGWTLKAVYENKQPREVKLDPPKAIEWVDVSGDEFAAVVAAVPVEFRKTHTINFCTPPLLYVWDTRLPTGEGWDMYNFAIARKYLVCDKEPPMYQLPKKD